MLTAMKEESASRCLPTEPCVRSFMGSPGPAESYHRATSWMRRCGRGTSLGLECVPPRGACADTHKEPNIERPNSVLRRDARRDCHGRAAPGGAHDRAV